MSPTRSSTPRNHRLFLALWPDNAVRSNVQAHAEGWAIPAGSVRYTPQDWHVTLHFLGSIPTDQVAGIAAGIDVPVAPFELVLDQPRLWPKGLAVVGASRTPSALESLHERLADALRGLRLTVETRPYRPHLTLARRANQAVLPKDPVPIVLPARSFVLVVSTGRKDHRYEVLREYGGAYPGDPSGDPSGSPGSAQNDVPLAPFPGVVALAPGRPRGRRSLVEARDLLVMSGDRILRQGPREPLARLGGDLEGGCACRASSPSPGTWIRRTAAWP